MNVLMARYKLVYLMLAFSCLLPKLTQAQQNNFPYKLSKKDYYLGAASLSLSLPFIFIEPQFTAFNLSEVDGFSPYQINPFDRKATNHWNPKQDKSSDILQYSLFALPAALALPYLNKQDFNKALCLSIMYTESVLINYALTKLSKQLINRTRPYMYNPSLPTNQRLSLGNENKARDSFYSGHTAIAFGAATFISKSYYDIYGKGTWSTIISLGSYSLATTTAVLRYTSGQHFPSDLIAGALVGSLSSYLILKMHKMEANKLSLQVSPNGFVLSYAI